MPDILALDIATKLGWAKRLDGGKVDGGSVNFTPKSTETSGARYIAFAGWLRDNATDPKPQYIAYEDIQRHASAVDAHVYGGFLAILEMHAERNRIRLIKFQVKTIKKAFSGNGNADKDMMIKAAQKRGYHPVDHNHADAIAILELAVKQHPPTSALTLPF